MLLQILEVLGQRQADALGNSAHNLSVHHRLVDNGTKVRYHGKFHNLYFSGLHIDLHHRQVDAVHVYGEGIALSRFLIAVGAGGGYPFALIFQRKLFIHHLLPGTVSTIGFSHGVDQHLAGYPHRVSGHNIGTGTAGRSGVGGLAGIVHHQLDLIRGNARLAQSLMGMGQSSDIRALSVIFPGIVDGDRAVLIEFRPGLGGIYTVQAAAVNTRDTPTPYLYFPPSL